MKKVLIVLLFSLILCSLAAEEDSAPKNAVSVDPIWILVNTYKGSYERLITDQISAKVDIAYSPNFVWGLHDYDPLTYLDVMVQGRYYIGSLLKEQAKDVNIGTYSKYVPKVFTDALGGLYAGVFVGYVNSTVGIDKDATDDDFVKASFNGFGGGLELGCKYLFSDKKVSFFIEPYGLYRFYGGSYSYKDNDGNTTDKPSDFEDGFDRNGLAGGVSLGLTF